MGACRSQDSRIENISISTIEYATRHGPVLQTNYINSTPYRGLNWFRGCMFGVYNRSLDYSNINMRHKKNPLYKVMVTVMYDSKEYVINNILALSYEQVNHHVEKIHVQLKLPYVD